MNTKMFLRTIWLLLLYISLPIYSAPLAQSDVTGWWAFCQGSLNLSSNVSVYFGNSADEYNAGGIIQHPETWDVSISGNEVLGKSLN